MGTGSSGPRDVTRDDDDGGGFVGSVAGGAVGAVVVVVVVVTLMVIAWRRGTFTRLLWLICVCVLRREEVEWKVIVNASVCAPMTCACVSMCIRVPARVCVCAYLVSLIHVFVLKHALQLRIVVLVSNGERQTDTQTRRRTDTRSRVVGGTESERGNEGRREKDRERKERGGR